MQFLAIFVFQLIPLLALPASAQVVGAATGFAKGVTGGGTATPAVPADIAQLRSWLTDSTPRVIELDKEYNFKGSQGSVTEAGCRPASNTCPNAGGQDAINGANWCTNSNYPSVSVTYDKASSTYIDVTSNKSIVGRGTKGVIRGTGLRIANGAKNVIIQNVHITDLNPKYIWGGDALTLAGSDMVWVDHCKFSLVGRQFIVSGFTPAGRVTISNTEFDGTTSWSASCNGDHYWTFIFSGSSDLVTLVGNNIHDVSGRAPKIGGSSTVNSMVHAVNNYFHSMGGHAFDVSTGGMALVEGNVFESVTTAITSASATGGGRIFNVFASGDANACATPLGRNCVQNSVTGSGSWTSYAVSSFLPNFSGKNAQAAVAVSGVKASVLANAGLGKINN